MPELTGAMTADRPRKHETHELGAGENPFAAQPPGRLGFDPEELPTLAEIEAMDMMPLLDTEREEDDLARPAPGSQQEAGLESLSFVCPHCDAPLPPHARACPRCRKAI